MSNVNQIESQYQRKTQKFSNKTQILVHTRNKNCLSEKDNHNLSKKFRNSVSHKVLLKKWMSGMLSGNRFQINPNQLKTPLKIYQPQIPQ